METKQNGIVWMVFSVPITVCLLGIIYFYQKQNVANKLEQEKISDAVKKASRIGQQFGWDANSITWQLRKQSNRFNISRNQKRNCLEFRVASQKRNIDNTNISASFLEVENKGIVIVNVSIPSVSRPRLTDIGRLYFPLAKIRNPDGSINQKISLSSAFANLYDPHAPAIKASIKALPEADLKVVKNFYEWGGRQDAKQSINYANSIPVP